MKREFILTWFAIGICASLVACGEAADDKVSGEKSSGALTIGNAQSFTGPLAEQGVEVEQGSDLVVAHINAAGGVQGNKLKLDKKDTAADPAQCTEIAEGFVQAGRKFMIGAISSGCTGAILDVTVPAQVLTLQPAVERMAVTFLPQCRPSVRFG